MGRDRSRSGRRERSRERDRSREKTEKRRSRDRKDRSRSRDRKDPSRSRERRDSSRGRPRKEDKPKQEEVDDVYKPGRQVVVKGLQKNPEKNGALGTLVKFDTEKSRWSVSFASGSSNNFKEENLDLMPDNSDVVDDGEPPTAKIYITELAADTSEQDLIDLFSGVGMIDKDKPKGNRAGFRDQWPWAVKLYKPGKNHGDACVTFVDALAAKAAIKTYNRFKLKGSRIGVAYAGLGKTFDAVQLQLPWHMREENRGKLDKEGGGGGGGGAGEGKRPGDWQCPSCGSEVYASKDSCFKCGEAKPGSGGGGGSGGGKDSSGKGGKSGDWTCSGCGANVFANKDSCFKCGQSRSGGGGGSGGGYGGGGGKGADKGGKAGDWTCPGCGANVFASKKECFKCGQWKP